MVLYDDEAVLADGPRLALRRAAGSGRPFLLVHGLSSNARTWDAVARHLAEAGHEVVAVDQRGHGHSEQVADGYTTEQSALDLADLVRRLGFTGARAPVVAGQSWGGNVVLELAARHGAAAALALVDGGWIRFADRFASFDECWAALQPPAFDARRADEIVALFAQMHPHWSDEARQNTLANFEVLDDGTVRPWLRREHHREIVRSLFEGDPRTLYPRVRVPVLLVPVIAEPAAERDSDKRAAIAEAMTLLPDAAVEWCVNADHDVHVQQPERMAGLLLRLAEQADRPDRSGVS